MTWHVEQVAYFLKRLKRLDEGGTSLLDNSMVMFGCGIKCGNRHLEHDLPIALAGRGKGHAASGTPPAVRAGNAALQSVSLDAASHGDRGKVIRGQHGPACRAWLISERSTS